jgi:3-phosphoshikimate 1-carboxyvinyltransferase
MKIRIEKGLPSGEITAPPSKSYAHRLLVCSALSGGARVDGVAYSEDILATLDCIKSLGLDFTREEKLVSIFEGGEKNEVFNCRESGSTLRFMIPLSIVKENCVTFTGTKRLMERGLLVYEEIFEIINFFLQLFLYISSL